VVSLSALRTDRLYHPGNIPGTHFFYRLSQPQGHSAAGRITSMKEFSMTPSGIEPATFRLVAQWINQLRQRVPPYYRRSVDKSCDADPCGRAVWGVGLRPLACWDRGFESYRGHGDLPVVIVVCCQVEVSATSWSLVQRSPTYCGASLSVIYKPLHTQSFVTALKQEMYHRMYLLHAFNCDNQNDWWMSSDRSQHSGDNKKRSL